MERGEHSQGCVRDGYIMMERQLRTVLTKQAKNWEELYDSRCREELTRQESNQGFSMASEIWSYMHAVVPSRADKGEHQRIRAYRQLGAGSS